MHLSPLLATLTAPGSSQMANVYSDCHWGSFVCMCVFVFWFFLRWEGSYPVKNMDITLWKLHLFHLIWNRCNFHNVISMFYLPLSLHKVYLQPVLSYQCHIISCNSYFVGLDVNIIVQQRWKIQG